MGSSRNNLGPATGYRLQATGCLYLFGIRARLHGCPILPGFGRCGKPGSQTSRLSHIAQNLAQRGPVKERAFRPASQANHSPGFSPGASASAHGSMGAPYLPGFGRCGKPRSQTSRLSHIAQNLAQRGPVEERAFRPASQSNHSPGFSPGAPVSGHEFTRAALCAKSTPGFSPCRFEGAQLQLCHNSRKMNSALAAEGWAPRATTSVQLPATGFCAIAFPQSPRVCR